MFLPNEIRGGVGGIKNLYHNVNNQPLQSMHPCADTPLVMDVENQVLNANML